MVMTIRQCMDAAFMLMNQYSIVGTPVPLSYNDQADAENRMVNLINNAQMQIATTVKPIEEMVKFEVPVPERGTPVGELEFEMPEGFNHFLSIRFTPANEHHQITIEANRYKWVNDTLLLPNRPAGTYTVTYTRYPERYDPYMSAQKKIETELDNTPDTHEAIPYFVAAMLFLGENPLAYGQLYNTWETQLSRLGQKQPHATITQVSDVYGFDYFHGVW